MASRTAQIDVAERAVRTFNRMLPGLEGFAEALTGKQLRVQLSSGGTRTDGRTIFLTPPYALGADEVHERALCDIRDEQGVPLCKACDDREKLLALVYHEISHVAFGTFTKLSDRVVGKLARMDSTHAQDISRTVGMHLDRTVGRDQAAQVAVILQEFMPMMSNAFEDIRVDHRMRVARPGTYYIQKVLRYRMFREGSVNLTTGERKMWIDEPLNSQAVIACVVAAEGDELEGVFDPYVVEVFRTDTKLQEIIARAPHAEDVEDAFVNAVEAMIRLQQHGFFDGMNVYEEPEPEPEPTPEPEPDEADDDSEEKDDDGDDGEGEGVREPEGGGEDRGADEPGDGSSDEESAGDGGERSDDSDGDSADGDEDSEGPEAGGADGADDTGDPGADEGADGAGEQEDAGADDDSASAGDGAEGDGEGAGAAQPGGDGSSTGDVSESGGVGDDEPGVPQPADGDLGEGGEGGKADPGAGTRPAPVERPEAERFGDSDSAQEALEEFLGHDDDGQPTAEEETTSQRELVESVVDTFEHFDSPSRYIGRVNEVRDPEGFPNARPMDLSPHAPQSILGPALLVLRKALEENKRAKMERNRRSGRVNARVLGRRAWNDDDRLFQRKSIPGKRDYAVLIGIDISGSTSRYASAGARRGASGSSTLCQLAVRAAYAQAELCHRLGIKFAVYAHTGSHSSLVIYEVKSFDEPWSTKQKEKMGRLGPRSANLDGHTLEYYRKRIEKVQTTDRIIMYYSDGAMPLENYDEELAILKREIKVCAKKDITLMAVGVRSDAPVQHGLDTARLDSMDDISKVVKHLGDRIMGA
jgi:hypothetical protein